MSSAVAAPASIQADHDGKGRVTALSGLSTIRARLYIALGFMAITTVICSLIGLYAFTNIGGTTTEIVSQSLPATVHSVTSNHRLAPLNYRWPGGSGRAAG